MHWAHKYIGAAYDRAGRNGDTCWSFVRRVQAAEFGRHLPEIPVPLSVLGLAKSFRDHPERRRWTQVDEPREGDCVLLRCARYPVHVGVWIAVDGGGVLHCVAGNGAVFQSRPALNANGWFIEGYYRFTGAAILWENAS